MDVDSDISICDPIYDTNLVLEIAVPSLSLKWNIITGQLLIHLLLLL